MYGQHCLTGGVSVLLCHEQQSKTSDPMYYRGYFMRVGNTFDMNWFSINVSDQLLQMCQGNFTTCHEFVDLP